MTRTSVLSLACFVAMSAFGSSPASAAGPTPERVFEHCVEHIADLAARCTARNAAIVEECLPLIRRLLADGQVERARRVARRCINAINDNTDECVAEIHQVCRRCVNALLDLHAPELARRLVEGCHRVVDHLRANQRRAVNAILDAF